MAKIDKGDKLSEQETIRRRDDAIRRAMNTPSKQNKDSIGKSARSAKSAKNPKQEPPKGRPFRHQGR